MPKLNQVLKDKWLVAYTKPRLEKVALENLERQAFEVYLPMYKKFKKTESGSVSVLEPMFPRYIFFRPTKQGQSIKSVRSTKGMSHVARFGFEPGIVSSELLETLNQFEEE